MGLKIVCADDSKPVLTMISRLISGIPEVDHVYKASNGEEAVRLVRQHSPDLVTLDIKMPVMDGIQALRKIRSMSDVPIIMISSYTQPGAFATIEALEEGAFGFIPKPASGRPDDMLKMRDDLIAMVRSAVESFERKDEDPLKDVNDENMIFKVNRQIIQPIDTISDQHSFFSAEQRASFDAIVIGCSAGGPKALTKMLPQLPAWFPWPILVVQHMPGFFTSYFSRTLNDKCSLIVKEGEEGEVAVSGTVYIAPGDTHMRVRKIGTSLKISLDSDFPEVSGARPSVDVLMESAATSMGKRAVGIVMSGMGVDGARGLLKMKEAGAITVVQDRASALIYGMAGTALKMNAARHVVSLDDLPLFLLYAPIVKNTHIGEINSETVI